MAKEQKKVSHMKTSRAEVRIRFRGKRMEITIVLPSDMEAQLTRRLTSPKRIRTVPLNREGIDMRATYQNISLDEGCLAKAH